ncbi:MAG: serine hydroxymethyltransferase [Thermovirgaceae bacterium]|jgi:glycine hydroxymethyltransferase|nr:serine hydroxymethyltransferase [Synergistales bacterium]MDI9393238.1 serine hydroxymethyltransferase [Synergistota bacterium]MDY0179170.1 serine hydroxymethyltransferase [Synergistaceae bacterium]HRW87340.1 serine hydroxymethyltransferase [Thermovirgaceae bacterium]MDD3133621.1 serine hydroxymethyltransferase [Synergistales bacterium]
MKAGMKDIDPEIDSLMHSELQRQRVQLELIASENFVPYYVLQAQGSVLTNKYAEGYPHKKYYGGCEFVESAEELAAKRACELFGAEHANVQPHSGTQANMAVYFSVLEPGDSILAMDLAQGGHLSHGHPLNFSGRLFRIIPYGVDRVTETIDYEEVARLARDKRPKLIVAGASAYPRLIDFSRFAEIAEDVGAYLMSDMAHIAGLVAGGVHPSPVPHSDFVTTTTHKTLRGPRGALVLCRGKNAADLDRNVFPGMQGGPFMQVIAGKATCFLMAMRPEFKEYARQIVDNASTLAGELASRGYRLVAGGTDNHMLLVDLRNKGLTGKEATEILGQVGITVNKNMIPFDPEKPMVTSGIRLGTPALTTRGMKEKEMSLVADAIDAALTYRGERSAMDRVASTVKDLAGSFPLYPDIERGYFSR